MSHDKKARDDAKLCEFLEGVRRRCPEHLGVLESLGDLYTRLGRHEDGLEIDQLLTDRHPDNDMYWYNLACSLSLVGRIDDALRALETSVDRGYDDVAWMLKDSDLAAVRKTETFQRLIKRLKGVGS